MVSKTVANSYGKNGGGNAIRGDQNTCKCTKSATSWLCEEGNFTRAARRSGVSQPSLTNAISALEGELGGPLFQRKPFTAMTALGYAIQPYMLRIVETADQAVQTAQAFQMSNLSVSPPVQRSSIASYPSNRLGAAVVRTTP
jgi:hypothetical protein